MIIRQLNRGHDRTAILNICQEWESPQFNWNSEAVEQELARSEGLVLINDNHLEAFILFRQVGEALEILLLATDPQRIRKGVMGELLGYMINNAWRQTSNATQLWLEVHEGNSPAIQLYQRLGFQQVGRRKTYYRDGSAAILFSIGLKIPSTAAQ